MIRSKQRKGGGEIRRRVHIMWLKNDEFSGRIYKKEVEMKLYIIGNGFDRAHNLPTRYWDFRTYLAQHYPDFLSSFEENYDVYEGMTDEQKGTLLWNELETNLANIKEDIIIEDATHIEMGLESGDVGIEETLRDYFEEHFDYIKKLEVYLKQWVRTIRIRDLNRFTSKFDKSQNDIFVTFNYTAVLETTYQIDEANVIHIHGSLRDNADDPILGHGNSNRIEDIKGRRNHADIKADEKESSICYVLQGYYQTTYKNVSNYMHKLNRLVTKKFDEIVVIGHSLAGVDLPYFRQLDVITNKKIKWIVYYFDEDKKQEMFDALISQGISGKRIEMRHCREFYDLSSN